MIFQKAKKNTKKIVRAALPLALAAVTALSVPVQAQAESSVDGSDYVSDYSMTISMKSLLIPVLNATSDSKAIYRQLINALAYRQITSVDIFEMRAEGVNIPDDVLKQLADDGLIPSYTYKFFSGEPYTAEDFADVFDYTYYYGANPDLMAAGVAYDENTLFQDFLNAGMTLGRVANSEFNLAIFKANYPELEAALGDNNVNYYIFYILIGKDSGMNASTLLEE